MGKGDMKTKKGKISRGTFGVTRSRKKNKVTTVKSKEELKKPKRPTKKKPPVKKEK